MNTLDHLDVAWQAWAATGSALTDHQWRAASRLPGWTVAELYAHHSGFPAAIAFVCAAEPLPGPASHPDGAALLAALNAPGGAVQTMSRLVRDHAVKHAAQHSRQAMIDRFRLTAPEAIAQARRTDPAKLVNHGGIATVPLAATLSIALMEAVVHYLDVARAVGLAVPGPVGGGPLRQTAALLAEVADPLAFVERATGRSDEGVLPVIR